MSKNIFDKADVILLGAGCANLSLAARANELIDEGSDDAANDWRDPEEPELPCHSPKHHHSLRDE